MRMLNQALWVCADNTIPLFLINPNSSVSKKPGRVIGGSFESNSDYGYARVRSQRRRLNSK
jgi:hypothetical protein